MESTTKMIRQFWIWKHLNIRSAQKLLFQALSRQEVQKSSCVPLVDEGVEAGEDEKRDHGTECHHIAKFCLQGIAVIIHPSAVERTIADCRWWILQPLQKILQKDSKEQWVITNNLTHSRGMTNTSLMIHLQCRMKTHISLCFAISQELKRWWHIFFTTQLFIITVS